MLPMLRRQFSSTLAVFLTLVAVPAAGARRGRLRPVAALRADRERAAARRLPPGDRRARGAAVAGDRRHRHERSDARRSKGLIGVDVPAWTGVTGDGALVIGTPALADRLGARLGRRAEGPRPRGLRHPRHARSAASAPSSWRRPATAARSTAPSTCCACCRSATPIRGSTCARSRATSCASSTTGTTSTARSSAATPAARCGSGTSCRRRSIRGCTTTRAPTSRSA